MEPHVKDQRAIVRLLSSALPSWAERSAVCSAAGIKDVQLTGDALAAWRHIVEEAQLQGRLDRLVIAAHKRTPDHPGLARVVARLEESGELRVSSPAGLYAFIGVVLVATVVGIVSSAEMLAPEVNARTGFGTPSSVPTSVADDEVPPAPAPESLGKPAPDAPDAPAGPTTNEPSLEPQPPKQPANDDLRVESDPPVINTPSVPTPVEPPPVATSVEGTATEKRASTPAPKANRACRNQSGWVYLGDEKTVRSGATWTVDTYRNVREDLPSRENDWNVASPRVCVLGPGWQVEVTAEPVLISGGAWWLQVGAGASEVISTGQP